MHMADALISPAVGTAFWGVSGGLLGWSTRRLRNEGRPETVPTMGVLGAFVFAAQMINFAIPGTGSSGHLGGGLLLTILLGPWAAFLTIASVLMVQALVFADGGLLALGCNIFNLGFFPAFVAHPWIYRPLAGPDPRAPRAWAAAVAAAVVGLELGALSVCVQTVASGIAELPWRTFLLWMLPIHLPIGVAEGLATAAVVALVASVRPAVVTAGSRSARGAALVGLAAAAALVGGVVSWWASELPDGLEWALARSTGTEEIARPDTAVLQRLGKAQERVALLPDYGFRGSDKAGEEGGAPSSRIGTTVSGLVGGALTLAVAGGLALAIRLAGRRPAASG